jgi:NADPH-dependent 2,4-dienoyl-CoA reductase/sulfur reductase-like enzyme
MNAHRLLVIGGVAAGMSAASRARRVDRDLQITVLEKGPDVSYGACGLPWLISGKIHGEELVVHDADFFRDKRSIEVLTGVEALEIEMGRRRVRALVRATSQEQVFHFDRLVIATGARVAWPSIPGNDLPHVFAAQTLRDATGIDALVKRIAPKQAVVIGGGYIGLEMAEALRDRGLEVTVLQRAERILRPFDDEITARVEPAMGQRGITLRKGASALAITLAEVISDAGRHPAQLVVMAPGMKPNAELAASAGVAAGKTGAIATDDRMQTNIASVYAAGDCAEALHLITRRPAWIPLGTTANKQGRVAGDSAAGGRARFAGIVGTMVTRICGVECARTGLSEREAAASSFRTASVGIEQYTHARYLGGEKLFIKLTGERGSGRLLGAQIAGPAESGKRIDVLAAALHARMTVEQVSELDLSYFPAVAPVWEAVLIAASELLKQL